MSEWPDISILFSPLTNDPSKRNNLIDGRKWIKNLSFYNSILLQHHPCSPWHISKTPTYWSVEVQAVLERGRVYCTRLWYFQNEQIHLVVLIILHKVFNTPDIYFLLLNLKWQCFNGLKSSKVCDLYLIDFRTWNLFKRVNTPMLGDFNILGCCQLSHTEHPGVCLKWSQNWWYALSLQWSVPELFVSSIRSKKISMCS